ncbi:hypothetical protein MYCTH_2294406 [Thermothelomyces thermophilus ATCC 42464]|uniref:Uncharacterized protein n=1 Tax=Thermothelomyces thermophilus (strain ATCC 42464 / BCRC 31852 / DSM 1799) TaxID=573729 RepID=G2Q196_THET4|nr:uncharacterized protein MYCTH_2294406 [Thermothelomyces thermophilus ATCC 42464]AEO53288.1 hypothetical protein MYCTH_2294406 [Thermothelomyces thermophilus ATCC 42464]
MPPNAPGKLTVGVAIGSTSVSVSELAEPGRGASDVTEEVAELSELGRGASVVVDEEAAELSELGRGASVVVDEEAAELSEPGRGASDVTEEEAAELSELGRGASVVVDEEAAELSELGRGASVVVDEEAAELSELGRGASDVDDATAEPSDTGAPATGTLVLAELVWETWEEDESASEVEDVEASEGLGGGTCPDSVVVPPCVGSDAREEDEIELASAALEGAAGGFPTELVIRAPSGTGITVTPTPPLATTEDGAPPVPDTPSTAPLA